MTARAWHTTPPRTDVGFYSIPGLFAGSYTVTFSAAGMKKHQMSLTLQNAQNAIINPNLAVGDVAEQVTVTANDVQLVTYDSGTVSTSFRQKSHRPASAEYSQRARTGRSTTPGLEGGGHEPTGLCRKVWSTPRTALR